jgi:hypothetical protein
MQNEASKKSYSSPAAVNSIKEMLPAVTLLRVPLISSSIDFGQFFRFEADVTTVGAALSLEHVIKTTEVREKLRHCLSLTSKNTAYKDWQKTSAETCELAELYLRDWNLLDAVLCLRGGSALQQQSVPSFSWRGPIAETTAVSSSALDKEYAVSSEASFITFKGAPAFEGLMIRSAVAVLYWMRAGNAVLHNDIPSAHACYISATKAFAAAADYASSRITYIPLNTVTQQRYRCLDYCLYRAVQHMTAACSHICRAFHDAPQSNSPAPHTLYRAVSCYEDSWTVINAGAVQQAEAQHFIWQNWRICLCSTVLRAAELLSEDKSKKIQRRAVSTAIGKAVHQLLDKKWDNPALVKRVKAWAAYRWNENETVYLYPIPVATNDDAVALEICKTLTDYLLPPPAATTTQTKESA